MTTEDKPTSGILEIHGVADAEKAMMVATENQSVTVTDDKFKVLLYLSKPPTAGLRPDQARFIANCLLASADRVERCAAGRVNLEKARAAKVSRRTRIR